MWKRLAISAGQVLLFLIIAEIGLQAAAFFVQRTTRAGLSREFVSGDLRVLCLGDSNTFGVVVDRDETWPAQLQTIWNASVEKPKIETLNLGFPGVNSSVLARDLPRLLATFEPDITIIMVGVNDYWTLPVPQRTEEPRESFWKQHSKLYRTYHLIRRGFQKDEIINDSRAFTAI